MYKKCARGFMPILLFLLGMLIMYSLAEGKQPAKLKVIGVPSSHAAPGFSYKVPRSFVYFINSEENNGSGVLIAKNILLTAAHVVSHDRKPFPKNYVMYEGKLILVKIAVIDYGADLALLEVEIDCPCATVESVPLEVDRKIILLGYPVTEPKPMQILTEGAVQGYAEGQLFMVALASAGNSGGGVFYFKEGKWYLVGIVRSLQLDGDTAVNHLSAAVSLERILPFLKEAYKKYEQLHRE